jgi:hypothetical protein
MVWEVGLTAPILLLMFKVYQYCWVKPNADLADHNCHDLLTLRMSDGYFHLVSNMVDESKSH